MAQLGSALDWGSRGRRFKSCQPDSRNYCYCSDFLRGSDVFYIRALLFRYAAFHFNLTMRSFPEMRTRRTLISAALAALLGMTAWLTGMAPVQAKTLGPGGAPITNDKGVEFRILAHRGGAAEKPENSVEAYEYSVAQGFDAIETDILFTKDGVGVMNHNDTLPERCTNAGERISDKTLAELSLVRCEDFRTNEKTVPIPTFEQFANAVAASDIHIFLDIKGPVGQSPSGEIAYAKKAIGLLKEHDLLARSSILSFRWDTITPTVRSLAPGVRIIAHDSGQMDQKRVRLAAELGVNSYGIKAGNSSAYLLSYIRSLGLESQPWSIDTTEKRDFAIHFGSQIQYFSSDTPAETRDALLNGDVQLNPVPVSSVTTLPKAVTVASTATYKKNARKYPRVLGVAVPTAELMALQTVTYNIKVTKGSGKGSIYVGPSDSPLSSSVRVKMPKGTKTVRVTVPVGDGGKIRVYTTSTAKMRIQAVAYTHIRFS